MNNTEAVAATFNRIFTHKLVIVTLADHSKVWGQFLFADREYVIVLPVSAEKGTALPINDVIDISHDTL